MKQNKSFIAVLLAFNIGFMLALVLGMIANHAEDFHRRQAEQNILCIDRALGVVYSCFENEDGRIEIKINPEGNRVIVGTVDAYDPTRNTEKE